VPVAAAFSFDGVRLIEIVANTELNRRFPPLGD
jgi:hypothetical protein